MDCPTCGHPNPAAARFCGSCATPLAGSQACPSCSAANPAGQRYCNACGRALAPTGDPAATADRRSYTPEHLAEKIRAGRRALQGERKQVTVLFADVMGSMKLAERCDPEEWRRIMNSFFSILCGGVHRYEGTVDKFTGDGMMALFGAPIAHEDHARRACLAALHLQRELAAYASELRRDKGLSLLVRMGLNSGEVVVGAIGEDLGMEYTAVGHTVGLAQRMEQLADPGKVFLTQHTASLVEGYFALADLGELQVKGASRPFRVWELAGIGTARGRMDVQRARGFSRFVGRASEMQVLEGALDQAFEGNGQVVGIVGDPGVGKSRLCHELAQRCRARGMPVYHVAGQAHAKSVALMPVLQILRAYFEVTDHDSDRSARDRIARRLLRLDQGFADDLPLMFDFLAVPDPERPVERMDAEARQRRLFALTKRLIHAESAREPGLTVLEDLQWFDPASEAFVANQIEAVQGSRNLTVVNFRPEYHAAWMSRSYYRQIALAPLGPAAIEQLLSDLLGADPTAERVAELVRERTRGNPFFIEELVQSLVEGGSLEGERGAYRLVAPVDAAALPATVHAVLAARIDRLARREKAVLQAAAVIGKEFSASVLERVVELDPAELEDALHHLLAGEFVFEKELYPEVVYAFKHPLTQQVAYGSQLAELRVTIHAVVAEAIAEQYAGRLDERAALLAHHWEAAGETLEAARWHARAARWAGYNDPTQALRHWRRVRALADALPESADTVALGLEARIALLQFGWRLGISVEEAEAVFDEGERLAATAGDVRSRALLLVSYGAIRGLGDGDVREHARLARQAIALAEESGDRALYVAVAPYSYALLCTGAHREGAAICDRAIELADGDPTVGAGIAAGCPYAFCHFIKGYCLVNLGHVDQARRLFAQSTTIAREQADIEVVGWTHLISVWLASVAGEPDAALRHAHQSIEIAERIGDAYSRACAWFWLGFAERMRGEWARAIEALERSQAIAEQRRTSLEYDGWRLGLLGEAYLGLGDAERARGMAEEGLDIARAQGNALTETHASLALARVLLGSGGRAADDQIEAVLAGALQLARDTGAKAFEPLVHVELAELARQSDDDERRERELREAHRLFAEIGATAHAERLERELPTAT